MKYRREIDGLRAVAVLPVVLYHAGMKLFGGGFIGVDVFFVISGYLITTIILTDMNAGTFSIATFYERRARRILPALFFVMFCCLPFAWFWLLPNHLKDFSESLAAVSVFSSNILFWKESGYFEVAAELKPLIHTWSLSVEEQYYLFFPVFLMAFWKLRKRWIFVTLVILAIVSLVVAQWGSYNYPSANFFLLPTRIWELSIGALIAFFFLYKKESYYLVRPNKTAKEILGLLGLSLIFYSIFSFNKTTPFPGIYALIPTIGTGLIIIFATSETIAGRFLSSRILVGIGVISYSTYLWHQPIFAFARQISFKEPKMIVFVILSFFSILLAYVSWRFIEQPFRNKNKIKRRQIFMLSFIVSFVFISVGAAGILNNGYADRFSISESIQKSFNPENVKKICETKYLLNGTEIEVCSVGSDAGNAKRIAVFGDSHSGAILPAFDLVGKQKNYSVTHVGLGGCPPLIGVDVEKGNFKEGVCKELASFEYDYVKNNNIKTVFLVARWSLYTEGDYRKSMRKFFLVSDNVRELTMNSSRANFEQSFMETMRLYKELGVEVVVLLQVPQQEINPEKIYYKLYLHNDKENILSQWSVPYKKHIQLQSYNREYFLKLNNLKVLNFDPLFCDENKCIMGKLDYSFYLDDDHLSHYGAQLLVDDILNLL